jgi:hypothetical protein
MKRSIVITSAVAILATAALATPARSAEPPHQQAKPACAALPELPARHIDAAGHPVPAGTPGAGLVRRFVLHGTVIPETVPPAHWNPLTAPSDQLARFGIPPRPRTEAARAAWTTNVSRQAATPRTTSTMCATTRSATSATPAAATSPNVTPSAVAQNWSGYVNTGPANTFWDASAAFIQPHFTSGCAFESAHTLFAGLGGWIGSPGLIEAGTDTFSDKVDGAQGFWELGDNINQTDTNEIRLPNFILRGGELATVSVVVAPDPKTGNKAAYFHLGVVGHGPSVTIGPVDTMPGTATPITDIYDGTSADYIDERPLDHTGGHPVDDRFYYLRQTVDAHGNPAKTQWFPATNAGQPGLTHLLVTMQRHNGTVLETPADRPLGFDNTWHACA